MDRSMCFSFDDLFRAAKRRDMTFLEKKQFSCMSQSEKNDMVKILCKESKGVFNWQDKIGTDGKQYTAFQPITNLSQLKPGLSFEEVEECALAAIAPNIINGYYQNPNISKTQDKHGQPLIIIDFPNNVTTHIHMTINNADPVFGKLVFRENRGGIGGLNREYLLTNNEMCMILHHYIESR